jgi:hypothetical protein
VEDYAMNRLWAILLFLAPFAVAGGTAKEHRDYVPDKKTAERIAEVILVGQYGEERVKAQLPLHADGSNETYWIVQGYVHQDGIPNKGGGFAVWINKHSGCIGNVVERMK